MDSLFSQFPETALLSILLQDPGLIDEVSDVKPFMLTSMPNKNLLDTVYELRNDGLSPDYGLIVSKLQERGRLDDCGGESYLKYLFNQNFEHVNLKEYSVYVLNSYKARQILSLSSSIPGMVKSVAEVDSAIEFIRDSLNKIGVDSTSSNMDIRTISKDAWEELIKRIENPNKIDYTTGLTKLDAVTGGYWEEDLWCVASRPGMGKTSFLCNSILSGIPSLVFSLEMSHRALFYRLASIVSGVSIFDIRLGKLTQTDLNKVGEAFKYINTLPISIDSTYSASIEYITSTIRKAVRLNGIKIAHIDYIQLVAERTMDATNELGRITRALKLLAKELGIVIIFYSQLNRSVELREDKRPILSDLRQSGNIEEDSDVVVFLYRDEMYNTDTKHKGVLELLIRKQRNGPTGVVTALFADQTNKMYDKE